MGIFQNADVTVLIPFVIYLAIMIGIGFFFTKRSKKMGDYFLAGRGLNSWVTAMSAQASDMSGWLLMGLPGAAYALGLCNYWLAIGLALGTILNWTIVAKRLRKFTYAANDSITIPEYFHNRFKAKTPVLKIVCAIIIFVFFLVYTSSAFQAGGTLFQVVFNADSSFYQTAVIISAVIIVLYTFFGGFHAVAWTDLIQGILMIIAIVALPIVVIANIDNFSVDMLAQVQPAFFSMTDQPSNEIINNLAWALGYFGMPHILVRFMAIKSSKKIKKSAIIAIVWVVISLFAAVLIGMLGRVYLDQQGVILTDPAAQQQIFITLVSKLFPGLLAGVFLSAVLASIMSTADSQLLVTASAVANDFCGSIFKKKLSDKTLMWISRGAVMAISVIACVLALNPDNTIMNIVANAWAGFGAAFGPAIIFSLYWKRVNLKGTVAGIIGGGATVLLWCYVLNLNGWIYAIIPGVIVSVVLTVVVSLLTKKPGKEVEELFIEATKADV